MVFNIRNIAAFFYSCFLITIGRLRMVKKRSAKGEFIMSVYFHDPAKKLFESCVKWFLKNGFTFISPEELEIISREGKPFPKSAVLFTVDDGWKNNKENIAEVANRYKIPVTIFASTEPIATGDAYWWSYIAQANKAGLIDQSVSALKKVKNEERLKIVETVKAKIPLKREALTVEELKEISNTAFVSIGSHTVTHPILSTCTDQTAFFEINESRIILEDWLKKKVVNFAYPNGDYTSREIGLLKAAGYRMAFTTQPQYINAENISELYKIPRFDVLETISFTENICRMTGLWFNKSLFNGKN